MADSVPTVVIDLGSYMTKAGLVGRNNGNPDTIFPTVFGAPRHKGVLGDNGLKDLFPVERGSIVNSTDKGIQHIFRHALQEELKIVPSSARILVAESSNATREIRELVGNVLFDILQVPSIALVNRAVLALHASGRSTGLVVDIGDGIMDAVPVYKGRVLANAKQSLEVAGRDVLAYLGKILAERGYEFSTPAEYEAIIRPLKDKHCYTALDFDEALGGKFTEIEYPNPLREGETLTIGNELFRAPEALFQPSFVGAEDGVAVRAYNAITNCDDNAIKAELWGNVVIAGGPTMCKGFAERLQKELTNLVHESTKVNVIALPDRDKLVYRGGWMMASDSAFEEMWISKAEWTKEGVDAMIRKAR